MTVDDQKRMALRVAVIDNIIENYLYRDSQMVLSFQSKLTEYLKKKSLGPFSKTTWEIIYFLCSGLYARNNVAPSDIYSSIDVSKTAVIRYLNRLESWGIVEKHTDSVDKRRKFVKFTPEFEVEIASVVDYCADNYGDLIDLTKLLEKAAQEQDLQDRLSKFREFAKVSSDWFWETDQNHAFTWISKSHSQFQNFKPARKLGTKRWDYHAPTSIQERVEMDRHRADLDAGRPFRDFVFRVVMEDGHEAWCAVNGNPIFDAEGVFQGYFGSGRDVTDRRRAIEALRRSENQLREMNNLATDCCWILDKDFTFNWYSKGCQPLINQSGTDLKGTAFWDLLAPVCDDGVSPDHALRENMSQHRPFQDILFRVVGGPEWNVKWHHCSGVPIFDTDGRFDGYQGICKEVTKQIRTEILMRSQRDILVNLLQHQPVNELIDQALEIISHLRPSTVARLYVRSHQEFVLLNSLNSGSDGVEKKEARALAETAGPAASGRDGTVTKLYASTEPDLLRLHLPDERESRLCDTWASLFRASKTGYEAALTVEIEKHAPFTETEKQMIRDVSELIALIMKNAAQDQKQKAN